MEQAPQAPALAVAEPAWQSAPVVVEQAPQPPAPVIAEQAREPEARFEEPPLSERPAREYAEIVEEVAQTTAPLPEPQAAMPLTESPAPVAQPQAAPALKLEWPSDLVQIETDPQKVSTVVVEAEAAPHPRRVRAVVAPISDEPLVQVETHKREPVAESAPL